MTPGAGQCPPPLTLSTRGSLPKEHPPGLATASGTPFPQLQSQTGQGQSGEGPGMGMRGRVEAGATSSGGCLRPVGTPTGRHQCSSSHPDTPGAVIAWPLTCPQQASSWKTDPTPPPQQTRWRSPTFWPLCSHNHSWTGGEALTLRSSCQQPGTRPTSSTALDPDPSQRWTPGAKPDAGCKIPTLSVCLHGRTS